jgi:hypothetical protein
MRLSYAFSFLLVFFVLVFSSCSRSVDYNYEHTLNFFQNLRIEGRDQNHLDSARRKHLENIAPADLYTPFVFFGAIGQSPSVDRQGSIFFCWSEDKFRDYRLAIEVDNLILATKAPVYTSQESDGRKEKFDFVVHDASYPLSLNELVHIVEAFNEGKQIHLTLRHPTENRSSQPVSWEHIHRTTQESWARSGNCWETALGQLLEEAGSERQEKDNGKN